MMLIAQLQVTRLFQIFIPSSSSSSRTCADCSPQADFSIPLTSSSQSLALENSPINDSVSLQDSASAASGASGNKHQEGVLDARVRKRDLNTQAARRYRQRRTDEKDRLASELKETQVERDSLKVKVARLEGELEAMKQMLRSQSQR